MHVLIICSYPISVKEYKLNPASLTTFPISNAFLLSYPTFISLNLNLNRFNKMHVFNHVFLSDLGLGISIKPCIFNDLKRISAFLSATHPCFSYNPDNNIGLY